MTEASPEVRTGGGQGSSSDPWDCIRVFRRLDVGPVRVEPQRLVAPYTLTTDAGVSSSRLIYRYERNVFDPADPVDRNLASMVAAQLALNYGLFTEEICFDGLYDDADRQFLSDMAENTAREITVKKFLEENPFLRGPAARLPVVKRERYSRAKLSFTDTVSKTEGVQKVKRQRWSEDPARHAVLSSGGKESLLTFGLLKEIGSQAYPIFINESGRHWLTALNGHRHLAMNYQETARVWANCDRMFSWFLRQMPFVRQDFANVRSDEYPIRLWTVAVFSFGALPVMRRNGIGRLSIGDEFDTSRRCRTHGIPHYDGLYDQSIYFDRALTRYFHKKGYEVQQFSLLRCLSEMLVQKTLAERYPSLFEHQVSCHAAHIEQTRVRPCGKCEKCRRVVGMLTAFGIDPTLCGYTKQQAEDCLNALSWGGVHQEAPGAQHLAHMLSELGLLHGDDGGLPTPRQRPEVLKLRFDPDRSPRDEIPADLQRPLFEILMKHAVGALERIGRTWVDYDPLATARGGTVEFGLGGSHSTSEGTPGESSGEVDPVLLGDLTWPEAKQRFQQVDVALLPVGAIEQHGPHLPLDTDAFDAAHLAREVALACSEPRPLVLPLVPYGVSYHHDDFSGTLSISPDTLAKLVQDIGMSAARNGVKKLIIVNGHGGNDPALHFAAQLINRDASIFTCVDSGETSDTDVYRIAETPNDVHAGEIETSTTLALRPGLVRMERARKFVPKFSSHYLDFTSKRSVVWYAKTARISKSGVLGDPSKASREKGEQIWAVMIRNLVELVEHVKPMSLEEIYQKRY